MKGTFVAAALMLLFVNQGAHAASPFELSSLPRERVVGAMMRPANPAARIQGVDFAYRPLVGRHAIQDESFYLLTLLEGVPGATDAVREDAGLAALRAAVLARAALVFEACETELGGGIHRGTDVRIAQQDACSAEALRWTGAEREETGHALGRIFDRSPVVRRLVTEHLRASGRFHRDWQMDDRALLVQAWKDALEGIDRIIRVYALGEKARYADIDSPIYPGKDVYYRQLIARAMWQATRKADALPAPWAVAIDFGMLLMEANRRDDALRQLLLQEEHNRETLAWLATVDWSRYPYAAITVPGWSPEGPYEPLNPGRKLELRLAVEKYNEGLAPYILVSGGRLRPIGTLWTEGEEMKRFMIEELGFPADRILISTVSRHTPTEYRDYARLIFRSGAPLGKKAVTLDLSRYAGSPDLRMRWMRDLGYAAVEQGVWLDAATMEFTPRLESLHREATDPMNP